MAYNRLKRIKPKVTQTKDVNAANSKSKRLSKLKKIDYPEWITDAEKFIYSCGYNHGYDIAKQEESKHE